MSDLNARSMYEVIWRTRRLFRRLSVETDKLHKGIGITAAQRAVLEFLESGGPLTVPAIARARAVSRQHIQTVVNGLLKDELVDTRDNPAHARSPLIELTAAGRRTYRTIRRREEHLLERMAENFEPRKLATTATTLAELESFLRSDTWRKLRRQATRSDPH